MAGSKGYHQTPQTLDAPTATFVVDSLSGGINTLVHPTRLNPDEAALIQNMRIKSGVLAEKRQGTIDTTTTLGTKYTPNEGVFGLGNLQPNVTAPTNYVMAAIAAGGTVVGSDTVSGLYRWSGVTGTGWQALTLPGAAVGDGVLGNQVKFVQVFDTTESTKDQIYIFEEGNPDVFAYSSGTTLAKVNGSADGVTGSVPQGKDALFWLSRLWVAGQGDQDGYVYFSSIGDPSIFDTSQGFLINPNDDMMRIIPFMQNGIICFMRESIWLLDVDQANFGDLLYDATSIMPLNTDIGTVAPRSVVQAGQDFFFLSRHGVHRLSKTERDRPLGVTDPVSTKIQGTIDRINWDYADNAAGVVWDNLYLLAVPLDAGTSNNAVLVYDMLEDAWSIFTGWSPSEFLVSRISGIEKLYYGDNASGKVLEIFRSGENSDDGENIESIVETPRFSFGGTHFRKHFQYLDLYCSGATGGIVELFVAPDEGDLTFRSDMTITDGSVTIPIEGGLTLPFTLTEGGLNRKRFYLDSFGAVREMQFKFRVTGTNRAKILYYSVNALPEQENYD